MTAFGKWLSAEMSKQHLSDREFGERIGKDRRFVGSWLFASKPSAISCGLIAKGLGLPVARVYQAAGYPFELGREKDRKRLDRQIDQLSDKDLDDLEQWLKERLAQ